MQCLNIKIFNYFIESFKIKVASKSVIFILINKILQIYKFRVMGSDCKVIDLLSNGLWLPELKRRRIEIAARVTARFPGEWYFIYSLNFGVVILE